MDSFRDIIEDKIADIRADFAIAFSVPEMRTKENNIYLKAKLETLMEILQDIDRLEHE